jgi:MoxR-like ATPase
MQHYNDGIFGSDDDVTLDEVAGGNYVHENGIMPLRIATTQPIPYQPHGVGTIPMPAEVSDSDPLARPWWQWLLMGAGVGVAVHLIKKSGLMGNPVEETPFQVASNAAAIAVQANIPVILWGPPGIGKTEWMIALGEVLGVKPGAGLEIVLGSTKDPADIAGILMPTGETRPPKWAQDIQNRSKAKKRSLLFLDEFSLMTPLVQGAMLRVVRDKVAGETNLEAGCGDCVAVVAAANKPEHTSGALPLPPPSANRLIHIDWPDPDPRAWVKGLLLGWQALRPDLAKVKLSKNWKKSPKLHGARQDIADFMSTIGELSEMPKDTGQEHFAWPSPRSWDNAALALGAARSVGASDDVQFALLSGAVGQAQALEFMAYTTQKDLPDPEEILKKPRSWSPPDEQVVEMVDESGKTVKRRVTRNDIIFAVINSVVAAVQRKFSVERWKSAWEFLLYLEEVATPAERGVIVIGAAGLMEMVGHQKGLDWGVVEKHLPPDRLGPLFKEMQKAKIIPKVFGG